MTSPPGNVDVFWNRPDHEVVALLPGEREVAAALEDLQAVGVGAEDIRLLHGEEGARILDPSGAEHGFRSRVVRFLQNVGYDQNILAVYDEGLRKGEALLSVPVPREKRREVAQVLIGHGGHAVIGFTATTAETFSSP